MRTLVSLTPRWGVLSVLRCILANHHDAIATSSDRGGSGVGSETSLASHAFPSTDHSAMQWQPGYSNARSNALLSAMSVSEEEALQQELARLEQRLAEQKRPAITHVGDMVEQDIERADGRGNRTNIAQVAAVSGRSTLIWLCIICVPLSLCAIAACACRFCTDSTGKAGDKSSLRKMQEMVHSTEMSLRGYEPANAEEADIGHVGGPDERFNSRLVCIVFEKVPLTLARQLDFSQSSAQTNASELTTLHECLMTVLDSPLNKAGKLLALIHTDDGTLLEAHPSLRVPRVFKDFVLLLQELLKHGKVEGHGADFPLLRIVSGPLHMYFPKSCPRFGLSMGGRATRLRDLVEQTQSAQVKAGVTEAVVFAVSTLERSTSGALDFGPTYVQERISICPWPVKARYTCQAVCSEYNRLWS